MVSELKRDDLAAALCAECGRPLDSEPFARGADGELHHRSCRAFEAMDRARTTLLEGIGRFLLEGERYLAGHLHPDLWDIECKRLVDLVQRAIEEAGQREDG
jgi:hypothetical protein